MADGGSGGERVKVLILGVGSIGHRHGMNVRALHPRANLVLADPRFAHPFPNQELIEAFDTPGNVFADWRAALAAHPDATAAIIASPTDCHGEQMWALAQASIPFYVEKPLGTVDIPSDAVRCATGFQYRYHPAMPKVAHLARQRLLTFTARDDLLARYGPRVADIMGAHPIDTALRLLGPARRVSLDSDGVWLYGGVEHENGHSTYDLGMRAGQRVSRVSGASDAVDLPPNDEMYRDALTAWLAWVVGGVYTAPLATLADGLAVQRVLDEVRYVGG